jgi:tellurite resistance protein
MNKIFKERQLYHQTFFQKLFKIKLKENAIIEINNLLAVKNILSINIEEIENIINNYKINFHKYFKNELLGFFATYLRYCLNDNHLSATEIKELNHLKRLFNLNDTDTKKIYDDTTTDVYKKAVSTVVADGILDKEEKIFLENIEKNLHLPKNIADNIYKESASSILHRFINNAISDQRLSPEEENELSEIANNLNIELSYDTTTKKLLDKYRLFWQIENGILPVVHADISLQKNENCHLIVDINWLEQRTVTKRINYGGARVRIKITKGFYVTSGSIQTQRITEDVWKNIDSGKIFLTNKRVIFMGLKANKTIALKKILDFSVYSNGIQLEKDSGKSPFFEFNTNTDILGMILGKLIRDNCT